MNWKIKIGDAALKLNVSVKTLQRWDREGVLIAKRTPTDRRYYTEEQLNEFLHSKNKINTEYFILNESDLFLKDKNIVDNVFMKYNEPLFRIIDDDYIIYNKDNIENIAKEFKINIKEIEKNSVSLKEYIKSFGDIYDYNSITIHEFEFEFDDCANYVANNLGVYSNRIYYSKNVYNEFMEIIKEVLIVKLDKQIESIKREIMNKELKWD